MTPTIPSIDLQYNLGDVATALANNLNSLWLILAFVVGIGLAFKFAGNIKSLFD